MSSTKLRLQQCGVHLGYICINMYTVWIIEPQQENMSFYALKIYTIYMKLHVLCYYFSVYYAFGPKYVNGHTDKHADPDKMPLTDQRFALFSRITSISINKYPM